MYIVLNLIWVAPMFLRDQTVARIGMTWEPQALCDRGLSTVTLATSLRQGDRP